MTFRQALLGVCPRANAERRGLVDRESANLSGITAERIARNQDVFRTANQKIRDSVEQYEYEAPAPFICECSEPTCQEIIIVDLAAYERIRTNPRWFLIAPGHEAAAQGHAEVVSEEDGYVIVEKTGRAGEVAEELDKRSKD